MFKNSMIGLVTAIVLAGSGFFVGTLGGHTVTKTLGVPLEPTFNAVAWCTQSPRPSVAITQTPNDSVQYVATRGKEQIVYTKQPGVDQGGAIYWHQVIPPNEKVSQQVSETVDFQPDAQQACFSGKVR